MKIPFINSVADRSGASHLYPDTMALRSAFSFKTKYGEEVELFKEHKDGLLIPRQCGTQAEPAFYAKGRKLNLKSKFVPRNKEQERLISESTALLQNNTSHILEAPTGSGKTIMGAQIAYNLGRTTGIIVPKSDLIGQWRKALNILFGLKPHEIGLVQGDTCIVAGKPFVIMMVHSVCKEARYPDWIYKEFGTLLVDENHVISAETFSESMWKFTAVNRLGLTATAYRLDGKDFVFNAHIGQVAVKSEAMVMVPKIIVQQTTWKVPMVRSIETDAQGRKLIRKHKLPITPGKTMNIHKLLAQNEPRNNTIVNFMKQAYDSGRRQIFFSELREEHLGRIELLLIAKGIPKSEIGWYVGGLKESQLEVVKRKRILLATYRMACVYQGQEVVMPLSGEVIPMKDLGAAKHVGHVDDSFKLCEGSEYVPAGVKPCVELVSSLGAVVVSIDHLVETSTGWQEAGSISAGDLVVAPRNIDLGCIDIPLLSVSDMWLIGLLIGDGDFTQRGYVGLSNISEAIIKKANKVMALHGMFFDLKSNCTHKDYVSRVFQREKYSKNNLSWIVKVLRTYRLQGLRSYEKTIPLEFMVLPKVKIGALVSGLIDSDGWVTKRDKLIGFGSTSYRLTNQVSTLFTVLGGLSTKVYKKPYEAYKDVTGENKPLYGRERIMYCIMILSSSVSEVYPWLTLTEVSKARLVRAGVLKKVCKSTGDTVPVGSGKRIASALKAMGVWKKEVQGLLERRGHAFKWLYQRTDPAYSTAKMVIDFYSLPISLPPVRLVPILSVKNRGDLEVGDISVKGSHNFVCSGIIIHNSMATDIPWLDTCILGTPRSDVVQIVGRILREYDDKKEPVVLDLVDMDSSVFTNYYRKRLGWYRKIGATVIAD